MSSLLYADDADRVRVASSIHGREMGSTTSPIIAVDFDDVISETNQDVADCPY